MKYGITRTGRITTRIRSTRALQGEGSSQTPAVYAGTIADKAGLIELERARATVAATRLHSSFI